MRWKPLPEGEYHTYRPPSVDDTEEDLERRVMHYPADPPDSFVISGPLPGGAGPGRAFGSVREAIAWARGFYGRDRIVRVVHEAHPGGRWAIRVRPRRSESGGSGR